MRDRSPSAKGPLSGPCRRAWDTFRLHPHSCCFLCAYRVAVSSLHCSICHIWVPSGNSLFVLADSECKLRATLVMLLPAAGRSVLPMLRTKSGCCRKPAKALQQPAGCIQAAPQPPAAALHRICIFPRGIRPPYGRRPCAHCDTATGKLPCHEETPCTPVPYARR